MRKAYAPREFSMGHFGGCMKVTIETCCGVMVEIESPNVVITTSRQKYLIGMSRKSLHIIRDLKRVTDVAVNKILEMERHGN